MGMEVGNVCPRCFSFHTVIGPCEKGGPEDGVDHLHESCLDCGFDVVVPLLPLTLDLAVDTEKN